MKKIIIIHLIHLAFLPALLAQMSLQSSRYQTMVGFGASEAFYAGNLRSMPTATRDTLLNLLFTNRGAAVSVYRSVIMPDAGDYATFTSSTDSDQYWMIQQAQSRGSVTQFFADPYTPPAKWKANNSTDGGPNGNDPNNYLLAANYQNYATYLSNYVKGYAARGINVMMIDLQNEPDWNANYPSCVYTPTQLKNFAKVLKAKFKANGLTTYLGMPECGGFGISVNYLDTLIKDPAADSAIDIYTSHGYSGTATDVANLYNLATAHKKPFWQTESSGDGSAPDSTITYGLMWSEQMVRDLSIGNVNVWMYWWMINFTNTQTNPDNEGLINTNGISYTIPKRFWTFCQFSRFIRPGAQRIGVGGVPIALSTVAFIDSVQSQLILVVVDSNATNKSFTIDVSKYPVDSMVKVTRTTATANATAFLDEKITGTTFSSTALAKSVTTYVFSLKSITTGTAETAEEENQLIIWPNPTSGVFQITNNKLRMTSVRIYNMIGEQVYSASIVSHPSSVIDISNQPAGVYFLKVKTENGVMVKKIVKE